MSVKRKVLWSFVSAALSVGLGGLALIPDEEHVRTMGHIILAPGLILGVLLSGCRSLSLFSRFLSCGFPLKPDELQTIRVPMTRAGNELPALGARLCLCLGIKLSLLNKTSEEVASTTTTFGNVI